MASTYLSRTTGTPTQQNTWTWSAWVKFSDDNKVGATDSTLLSEYYNAGSYTKYERIANNTLRYGTGVSGQGSFVTNRRFSDLNAWYHLVIVNDWSNSTTADRIKLYVNGVRETSFASFVAPSSGSSRINGDGEALRIGTLNNTLFFNGSMSYVAFVDGTAELPTIFGETDSVTGQWKIKTDITPSVAWGNNGFFILKDGNSVTDQSGNSNNFTVGGGTLTSTKDCPDNVFATLNPLDKGYTGTINLANGNNTTMASSGAGDYGLRSTLGASSGKYYFEVKVNGGNTQSIGDMDARLVINMQDSSPTAGFYGFQRYSNSATNLYNNGSFVSQNTAMWGGITAGDIISFAVDLDNSKIFLQKNGTGWKNTSGATGDPVNGTNPTFTIADATKTYGFYCELRDNADNQTQMNFGNGVFGTTAVTSAGTAGSTPGTFEYDVPSGYQPLSTKGLNA